MKRTAALLERLAGRLASRLRANRGLRALLARVHNLYYFADLTRHDDMLADRRRVDTYHEAINKHVRAGDEVIDLGTGTGLLACYAARAGAKVVHAVEYGPVIAAAERVAQDNGIANVAFHRVSSREFTLPHKVDVIVHEQMGAALFNEHAVANLVDLRDRLLEDGGVILPHRLCLFVAPVQAQAGVYAPFAWEQSLHGLRFDALRSYAEEHPQGYLYRGYNPLPLDAFLAEPHAVVEVDLLTVDSAELPTSIRYSGTAIRTGVLHGFCVFFEVHFDDELSISTSPVDPDRAVHWAVPMLRAAQRDVHAGDRVSLDLRASELAVPATWRWDVDVTPAQPGAAVNGSSTAAAGMRSG